MDTHPGTIAEQTATGISFHDYTGEEFYRSFERVLALYHNRSTRNDVIRTGMTQDFSWNRSSEHYVSVYRAALNETQERIQGGMTTPAAAELTAESR